VKDRHGGDFGRVKVHDVGRIACQLAETRDVARAGLGGLKPPPSVILAPPQKNEFQPMKYPGLVLGLSGI